LPSSRQFIKIAEIRRLLSFLQIFACCVFAFLNFKKLPEFGAVLVYLKRSPLFPWGQKTPKNGKN
jgi:hypothetical protein